MRPIFYDLILGYICLNLAMYIVAAAGVFAYSVPNPSSISAMDNLYSTTAFTGLLSNPLALTGIGISGIGGLALLLLGKNLVGFGFITLAMLMVFTPTLTFVIGGLPALLTAFNVSPYIVEPLLILFGFIFIVFVVEFVGQRDVG